MNAAKWRYHADKRTTVINQDLFICSGSAHDSYQQLDDFGALASDDIDRAD